MTFLLKDPDAVLDYAIDWGAEYLGDAMLSASAWSVIPTESGGVTIDGSDFDMKVSTVKAGGGIAGRIYRLENDVMLGDGRRDSRSIVLRVEKR